MGRLIKYLIYLAVMCFIALAIFAYVGPFFGVEIAPPLSERSVPVDLDGQ